jgi:transposase InsO family protein
LHVVSLAQYAAVYTRSWAADSRNARVRLKAKNGQLQQEVALLRAEIRIKDPDCVRYAVQRLQALCPTLGKKKLAEILARAGLHLGVTTVGRIRKERPEPTRPSSAATTPSSRTVTAKRPNHVWHVDLTTVSTQAGFWCSWLPCALPQCWPFCWWMIVLVDHYSRRVMGCAVFKQEPTAVALRAFLGRAIHAAGTAPRHLISDQGSQFWPTAGYKHWCRRKGIRPRFGAVGEHGSIALIERLIWTLKDGLSHRMPIPLRREAMRQELHWLVGWYNEHRPHTTLQGRTPK